MDILATLSAIKDAVAKLQTAPAPTPTPTSNFATDDVKSSISDLATTLGVTPVPSPA